MWTGPEAILHLERAMTMMERGEGLALRYGGFYGPGTGISLAPDAVMAGPCETLAAYEAVFHRADPAAFPTLMHAQGAA